MTRKRQNRRSVSIRPAIYYRLQKLGAVLGMPSAAVAEHAIDILAVRHGVDVTHDELERMVHTREARRQELDRMEEARLERLRKDAFGG